MIAMEETTRSTENGDSVRSYADRVHRYLAYKASKIPALRPEISCNRFTERNDGTLRFSAIGGVIVPTYMDSEVSTKALMRLIDSSDLTLQDKKRQVKAIARIALLEARQNNYTDVDGGLIQNLDAIVHCLRGNRSATKQPRFDKLYSILRGYADNHHPLPHSDRLAELCRDYLLVKKPSVPKPQIAPEPSLDDDPTYKFRVKTIRQQEDEEIERRFESGEWDF